MNNPAWPPPYSLAAMSRPPIDLRDGRQIRGSTGRARRRRGTAAHPWMERIAAKEQRLNLLAHQRNNTIGGDPAENSASMVSLAAIRADLDRMERSRSSRNSVRANTDQIVFAARQRHHAAVQRRRRHPQPTTWPTVVPGPERRRERRRRSAAPSARDLNRSGASSSALRTAPLPAGEVKAAIVAEIDRMASGGTPQSRSQQRQGHDPLAGRADGTPPPGSALSAPSGSASQHAEHAGYPSEMKREAHWRPSRIFRARSPAPIARD